MFNKVILMGRLTKDPEMRTTPNGISVATFSIAVDRRFTRSGEQKQTDFFNIVAWRTTAEFVSKYFRKGQLVAVCGSLQNRSWDDNEGKKRYATEVIADEVHFAESKREQGPSDSDVPFVAGEMPGFTPNTPSDDDLPF